MISIKNLNKYYDYKRVNQTHALKDVSLTIEDGELTAIVGNSGAGKSTLLHILAGIDDFQSGTVKVGDKELDTMGPMALARYRNRTIGIVLQDFGLIEGVSIMENVMLPLRLGSPMSHGKKKERVMKALDTVGLSDMAKKGVHKLSGGQRQRVAIARAIVNDPDYIFADEPTGALDSETGKQIMGLFRDLNKKGKTVVIVTHDQEIAGACDRIVTVKDGRIK